MWHMSIHTIRSNFLIPGWLFLLIYSGFSTYVSATRFFLAILQLQAVSLTAGDLKLVFFLENHENEFPADEVLVASEKVVLVVIIVGTLP